jgi:hypothetical protein
MCGSAGVQQAARIAEGIDGQIVLAGDLAYMQGSMTDFIRCFDPYWGQFRRRWRPAPGNHEYDTAGAAGYFQYFGEAATGGAGRSYYSFRAGDWLVLMLDSNIATRVGTPQYEFVRSGALQPQPVHARGVAPSAGFLSSGPNGPNVFMRDMWGCSTTTAPTSWSLDTIISTSAFGKQDVDGRSGRARHSSVHRRTGGATLYDFQRMSANSQARVSARRAEADAQPRQLSVGVHRCDGRDQAIQVRTAVTERSGPYWRPAPTCPCPTPHPTCPSCPSCPTRPTGPFLV